MSARKVAVKVPASTANLGPGFDSLGMALELHAWLSMEPSDQTGIQLYGDHLDGVPNSKSNLVYEVAQQVFAEAGVNYPELNISMYSDIPLTRGLGSSASAIIGALVSANAMIGSPLSDDKLFQMASALEQHPDNVGASLFGGIIASFWDGARAEYIRIEPHPQLETFVIIPDFQLSTEKARQVLPMQYTRQDAVFNIGHSSLLTAALCAGRLDMIKHAMKDRIHQPYRSQMVPGMEKLLNEADKRGALGVALSGAGPTIIALTDSQSQQKQELESFMKSTLSEHGIDAKVLWIKPSRSGAEIVQFSGESFMDIVRNDREVRA